MYMPIGAGFHLLVLLGTLLFWGGLIVLIVWAIRSIINRPSALPSTPRQILDERLARGETTVDDYEKARAALENKA